MSDPLTILAYKIAPSQFDIGSDQVWISIRDQAVRVRMLLTAMEEARLFAVVPDPKVLVVGAGFAGVSAAMWLTDHGIETCLIEKTDQPFVAQRHCNTRFLSVTQYDWPASHFGGHHYPHGLSPRSIDYRWISGAGSPPSDMLESNGIQSAAYHVRDWDMQFSRLMSRGGFTFMRWTTLDPATVKLMNGLVDVTLKKEPPSGTPTLHHKTFTYVLIATGFPSDGADVPMIGGGVRRTRAFWSDDELADAAKAPPQRILISGGGDGALQDFIRALVGPGYETASTAFAAIIDHMKRSCRAQGGANLAGDWSIVEAGIADAEVQASSALAWIGERNDAVWAELERRYREAIGVFVQTWGDELVEALAHLVDRKLQAREITVVFDSARPGKVYALNRLLFMLLWEYAQYHPLPHTFFGSRPHFSTPSNGFPIVEVLPGVRANLRAPGTKFDPQRREYSVELQSRGGHTWTKAADEFLVRHGIGRPPRLIVRGGGIHDVGIELARVKLPYASVL